MRERLLRTTLYFTFFYNLMGFITFLAPKRFGQLAGLPAGVPFLFTGFIAFNILLFGLVGLWQARQPDMNRPVLAIFGISKITFCLLMGLSWLMGEVTFAGFLMSLVDFAMDFEGAKLTASVPGVFLPKPGTVLWLMIRRDRCFVFGV